MKKSPKRPPTTAAKPAGDAAAEEKFARDVVIRGEAARVDRSGKLPLDATHEIVDDDGDGQPKLQRRRFKAW